ncbi:putative vacuolar protein sorting-associated protein [Helianthus annuus]|nr:putative vacuolar protein sorting-associated protein [Helianthus annuus]
MERLSSYAASSPEVLPEFLQVEAFAKLSAAIGKVIVNLTTYGSMQLISPVYRLLVHW